MSTETPSPGRAAPAAPGAMPAPVPADPGTPVIPTQRGARHRQAPAPVPTARHARGSDPRRSRRLRLGLAAVVVGALVAAAVLVVVRLTAPVEAIGPGSSVAVIGDSYSQGTVLGGLGATNWTAVLGGDRDWTMTDTALGGTGYVATNGPSGDYATAQLDRALAAKPAMIVVQGSVNDLGVPPDRAAAAASALYARIRAQAPQTRLVVVGPFWPPDKVNEQTVLLRDEIGMAARDAGAVWIDPMTEGWFTGSENIGRDDVHPTDAGHALIAEHVGEDLHAAGL